MWVGLALLPSGWLYAGNGMYMISYGARYGGMAGAATALGGSVMDLHTNPALLGLNAEPIFEGGFRINYAQNEYRDQFIDSDPLLNYTNHKTDYTVAPLPYLGVAGRLNDALAGGLALYLVGGGGGQFTDIIRNTPRGTTVQEFTGYPVPIGSDIKQIRENVFARMAHARLAPGLAVHLGDWHVGVTLAGAFGKMEMRRTLSDITGSGELPGQGLRYKSDPAYALSGVIGIAYDVTESLRLGYSYSAPTVFHMDGHMSVNAGDPRFYHATGVSMRMSWPETHRAGIAWSEERWTISADVGYINWSSYLRTVKFELEDSFIETPFGFYSNTLLMNLYLRDQALFAIGLEYELTEGLTVRCGYNYTRANLESAGVNPLFAVLTEHHAALGLGIQSGVYMLDFAVEYAFPNRMRGADTSNWDIGHAVYGPGDIRLLQFEHERSMQAIAFIMGVTMRLN